MMKEAGVSHPNNEYHPYANGNMQHMYNNSRQTPDSGLGNEDSRNNSMNTTGGGDNSGPPAGGARAPPGFQENPYYGNAQQSQYNEQHQHQFRPKQYGGGPHEGGRSTGPPSIMTMSTSPPNMDQEGGGPSYNPNYGGNYQQYGNQGGPPYGGMDRNFNGPHQMAARSHSNFSESSSGTLNMPPGGGLPDASSLSGQPLMAPGPHGGMMYAPQGGQMGHPYGHPQMQQPPMQHGYFNPAAHAAMQQHHAQMMQGGIGQQGAPAHMQHPNAMQMQSQPGQHGPVPGGPPQSVSPPQPMMMVPMGPHGAHMPGPVYYPQMTRSVMVGQNAEGFVQFTTYPAPHPQQPAFPMRMPPHQQLQQQRSLNSPAPSDNTDGQSVHGSAPSIGVWTGPPGDTQSQHSTTPPSGMQPMLPQGMHPGGPPMHVQPQFVPMMTASFPGAAGAAGVHVPYGAPRMPVNYSQVPQMAMQHAMQPGMAPPQQMMGAAYNPAAGFHPQQPQSGYWAQPNHGGRGGFRGRGGSRGGWSSSAGSRPGSRQFNNSRTSITAGTRSRGSVDHDSSSKCTTPTEDDLIVDASVQMDSMRMDDQEGAQGGSTPVPHKQLLELADTKSSSSPPAEPNPCEDEGEIPQERERETESGATPIVSVPTTPRSEPRKELLEMKRTPKHESDKSSQSIPLDPVPNVSATSGVATGRTWSEVAGKPSCVYCRGKNMPVEVYSTHNLRGPGKKVECPYFQKSGCSYCGVKGDDTHDAFFCKERMRQDAAAGDYAHDGYSMGGDGGYRGQAKRGGAVGGGHYHKGQRGGGQGKYDNRRVQ